MGPWLLTSATQTWTAPHETLLKNGHGAYFLEIRGTGCVAGQPRRRSLPSASRKTPAAHRRVKPTPDDGECPIASFGDLLSSAGRGTTVVFVVRRSGRGARQGRRAVWPVSSRTRQVDEKRRA